jgi:hypothetical protein
MPNGVDFRAKTPQFAKAIQLYCRQQKKPGSAGLFYKPLFEIAGNFTE